MPERPASEAAAVYLRMRELFGVSPDAPIEEFAAAFQTMHTLPVPWMEPVDISNAVLWLASDLSRATTGTALTVDGGASFA